MRKNDENKNMRTVGNKFMNNLHQRTFLPEKFSANMTAERLYATGFVYIYHNEMRKCEKSNHMKIKEMIRIINAL